MSGDVWTERSAVFTPTLCGRCGEPLPKGGRGHYCEDCSLRVYAPNPAERARELCAERHDQPSNWQPCYFCFQDALAEVGATYETPAPPVTVPEPEGGDEG